MRTLLKPLWNKAPAMPSTIRGPLQDESQQRHTLNSLVYTLEQESVSKDDPAGQGRTSGRQG